MLASPPGAPGIVRAVGILFLALFLSFGAGYLWLGFELVSQMETLQTIDNDDPADVAFAKRFILKCLLCTASFFVSGLFLLPLLVPRSRFMWGYVLWTLRLLCVPTLGAVWPLARRWGRLDVAEYASQDERVPHAVVAPPRRSK